MPHPADFGDAHRRHWEDAELLRDKNRWANADQLYGFSAECGLKAVMQVLGMHVDDETGAPAERQHQKHVHELWPIFKSFAQRRDGASFAAMLPDGEPFEDWSHHDRYATRKHFRPAGVEAHREAAARVCKIVRRAMQDGRL